MKEHVISSPTYMLSKLASVGLIRQYFMNQNARVYTKACMRCVCVGWPGAPYSVDICEGLEDWSAANSLSNPSDTEEEDASHLVRHPTLTQSLISDVVTRVG